MKGHLDSATLEHLVHLDLERVRFFDASWHLFICSRCRDRLRAELPEEGQRFLDRLFRGTSPLDLSRDRPDHSRVLARAHRLLAEHGLELERQVARAPALWQELAPRPLSRQKLLVRNSRRFQTYGLVRYLLHLSRSHWHDDPSAAEDRASLALEVARLLDAGRYGRRLLNDLEGEAWSLIGNARRIRSDLRRAEEAFGRAEAHFNQGNRDPLERALLLDLEASLRRAQRRDDEAIALLDEAAAIYRRAHDTQRQGRLLISKAVVMRESGRPAEAIRLIEQAFELIDPEADPPLCLYAQKNLLIYLNDLGRHEEALERLPGVRRLALEVGGRMDLVRLRWVEGLLWASAGREAEAEEALREVRERFVAEGIGYDAALVSLDLAVLYLEAGRTAEARRLAATMLPIFRSRDIDRDALAALTIFQQALERETATVGLVRDVASYLEQRRGKAPFRFEKPN